MKLATAEAGADGRCLAQTLSSLHLLPPYPLTSSGSTAVHYNTPLDLHKPSRRPRDLHTTPLKIWEGTEAIHLIRQCTPHKLHSLEGMESLD